MKILPPLAVLIGIAAWALLIMTFANLLSGYMDERVCQTDCVRNYYMLAGVAGLVATLLGFFALFSPASRKAGFWSLVVAFPAFAVVAGIFVIGNFGHLIH